MAKEYDPIPNLFNRYRTFTYSFTISAVDSESIKNGKFRTKNFDNTLVLKSGGKGSKTIIAPSNLSPVQLARTVKNYQERPYDANESIADAYLSQEDIDNRKINDQNRITDEQLENNKQIIEGFNKDSSGRFDFFIENLEINGVIQGNNVLGSSLATGMSFTVLEPYSISGFIEALHVSAIAAGYLGYNNAIYLLKIEFLGYDENDKGQKINEATKYLLFRFRNVDIEITDRGTKYSCEAIAHQDSALGTVSTLQKPISAEGSKVGEILKSLFDNLNNQIKLSDKESQNNVTKFHDIFEIRFNNFEELENSKVYDFKQVNSVTVMPDITELIYNPEAVDTAPAQIPRGAKVRVGFNQGRSLLQCIESIIVDSEYLKKEILFDVAASMDEYGLVPYFIVKTIIENQEQFNDQAKDYYKKYIFIVSKYKIHITKIPNYKNMINASLKLKPLIIKEYNYTYTGKNIDVLNFKIEFKSLFYGSIPYAMGNNSNVGYSNSIGPNNEAKVKVSNSDTKTLAKDPTGVVPSIGVPTYIKPVQGTGNVLDDSPYAVLARNLHDSVINSVVNAINGELEILGDPIFLSGNIGTNEIVKNNPDRPNLTEYNDIDPYWGDIYIQVNFRNPVDLNKFSTLKVPFSGIYGIREIKNIFADGVFKQILKVYRIHSQILDTKVQSDPANVIITYPDALENTQVNSSPVIESAGIRADPLKISIPTVNNPVNSIIGKFVSSANQGISQLSQFSSVFSQASNNIADGARAITDKLADSLKSGSLLISADKTLQSFVKNAESAALQFSNSVESTLQTSGQNVGASLANSLESSKQTVIQLAKNLKESGTIDQLQSFAKSLESSARKIEDKLRETTSEDVAKSLGIDVEKLNRLNEVKLNNLEEVATRVSVNLPQAIRSGLSLATVPAERILNIPVVPPDVKAPEPVTLNMDLVNQNLAKAFGVNSTDKIPNFISPQLINNLQDTAKQFAQSVEASRPQIEADVAALKGKFEAATEQIKSSTGQFAQSLESAGLNFASAGEKVALNLFGNKTSDSPLNKIIKPIA